MRHRALIALAAALLLLVGPAPTASAVPTDQQIGDMSTFLVLFPELRTLPAPGWVAPGTRVTYQLAGATWATGGVDGSGGGGFAHYDVVSSDGLRVYSHAHTYGDGGVGLIPFGHAVGHGLPGVGPCWINPSVLDGAEALAGQGLTVTRYTKNVGGQDMTVVRFQTATQNGQTVFEIDAASGVLVFHSVTSQGGAAQVTLLGVRTLQLPWQPDRAPAWVRPQTTLAFTGTRTTTIPFAGSFNQQVSAQVTVQQAGSRWSLLRTALTIEQGGSGELEQVTGAGQLVGAFWLPQAALAAQLPSTPTRVDVDPHSGVELYVWREGGVPLLQQLTGASRLTWVYDPTLGVLERQVTETQTETSQETTDISRTGGSDLAALNQLAPLPDDPPPSTPPDGDPAPPGPGEEPDPGEEPVPPTPPGGGAGPGDFNPGPPGMGGAPTHPDDPQAPFPSGGRSGCAASSGGALPLALALLALLCPLGWSTTRARRRGRSTAHGGVR